MSTLMFFDLFCQRLLLLANSRVSEDDKIPIGNKDAETVTVTETVNAASLQLQYSTCMFTHFQLQHEVL